MSLLRFFIAIALSFGIAHAALAQDKYQSLLWEISGNGLNSSSYLYGTMHSNNKKVTKLRKAVKKAYESSSVVALELDLSEGDEVDIMGLMDQLFMDSSTTMASLMSPEDLKTVSDYFNEGGMLPWVMMERIKPIFLVFMVDEDIFNFSGDGSEVEDPPLDLKLQEMAEEDGKQVMGLETMDEQMDAINTVTLQEQADMLVEVVKHTIKEKTGEIDESSKPSLLELYLSEDLDELYKATLNAGFSVKSQEALITVRNKNMADRFQERVGSTQMFVAVGAAHLPGPEGVIELLRAKGYTLEPR